MGSTITCGKHAAAFPADGTTTYVLFEKTYESNVRPHRPHWSCRYFGDLRGALKRVFSDASVCEGGMLAAPGGKQILPEDYISAWLRQLARPARQRDFAARLWTGTEYYAPIPPDLAPAAAAILVARGHAEAAAAIAAGKAREEWKATEVRAHDHAPAITALLSGLSLPPWRLVSDGAIDEGALRDASLGYRPVTKAVSRVEAPRTYAADGNHRLLQREDGSWYCAGWAYSIVGLHVAEAWEHEADEPGRYRTSIPVLRTALHAAPPIPPGTRVAVTTTGPMDAYTRQRCEQVAKLCQTAPTPFGFEVVANEGAIHSLASLGKDIATWILPKGGAARHIPIPPSRQEGQSALL